MRHLCGHDAVNPETLRCPLSMRRSPGSSTTDTAAPRPNVATNSDWKGIGSVTYFPRENTEHSILGMAQIDDLPAYPTKC
jgi:hypothetical protein